MIRWLFAFWRQEQAPRARELPLLVFKAALFGAIFGAAASLPVGLRGAGYSAAMGAIFAVSFYVTCALPQLYLRRFLSGLPERVARAVRIAAGAVGGAAGFVIAFGAVSLLPGVTVHGREYVGWIALADAAVGAVLTVVVIAFQTVREQARRSSDAALQARMSALQSQINPHFLFNTLNSISAMIPLNAAAAQEMVGQLADLFRYTLASSQVESVSLDDELGFISSYLELERRRFSDRLRVQLPAGSFSDIRLPGLMLQPLVENAIRHGVAQRIDGGVIEIGVERRGASCRVTVRNECDSGLPENLFRPGHALHNIRERLTISGRGSLGVENSNGWVTATLELR